MFTNPYLIRGVCTVPKEYCSLSILQLGANHVRMNQFKSSNTTFIEKCRYFFHIELPFVQLQRRFEKFLANAANYSKLFNV